MPNTFKLIASSTVPAGGAANITLSSIPNIYSDLYLMLSARGVVAGDWADNVLKFNNSTANYTNKYNYANGSGVFPGQNAYTNIGGFIGGTPGSTNSTSSFNNTAIYIPNYASSAPKIYSVDGAAPANASTAYLHLIAGIWDDASAITSITIVTDNGTNYAQHSSAYLYGIVRS